MYLLYKEEIKTTTEANKSSTN